MIPITIPSLGEAESEATARVVRSGWLTQGAEVAAFERDFAASVGTPFACAVANCTAALHLALLALNVKPGDEVITVSHSFIATANAVQYCGAVPVFIDVEPGTFNIDPDLITGAITSRTRAILCVHQMGMPCDLRRILSIARLHGLPVVEDAACAAGSRIKPDAEWQRIGRPHGDIACFSFHPRKIITTGEGGMLTTRNADHDRFFRLARQHGMSVPDTARHRSPRTIFETYATVGFNYRMTDLQAALGRVQLSRLEQIVERRRSIAAAYRRLLADIPGVQSPEEPAWARSNWQSYCVGLPRDADQRQLMQFMLDKGIATRRGIMCAHMEEAYGHSPLRSPLPVSEHARDGAILLPIFPDLSEDDQQRVVEVLAAGLKATRPRRSVATSVDDGVRTSISLTAHG